MSFKEDFDDDYVARLLAEDAKKVSSRYASQGLSAFLPKKRAADAPKPNTRFLSHIVREADSHNAALKRKEEVEAERRLRALRDDERPAKRRRADESDISKRNRMLKDILGAAKDDRGEKRRSHESSRHGRSRHDRSRSPDRNKHSRRRSSSSQSDDGRRSHQRHREEDHQSKSKHTSRPSDDEVRVRGRGAHKHRSVMDEHFKEGYDPSQDVSLDSDHNSDAEDWDLALEAMRDRAKYKRSQASRMRDAGFSEHDIAKWEKGSQSKDREDGDISAVKWTGKGEVRAWDAGK